MRFLLMCMSASLFFAAAPFAYGQNISMRDNFSDYQNGLNALQVNNTDLAEKYFQRSINDNSDGPSYYELARIYAREATPIARSIARELIKKAVYLEPQNLQYRYFYAGLLEQSEILYTAREQYREIIRRDSMQAKAWYHLGRLEEDEFNDFNQSIKTTSIANVSYRRFAHEDFRDAERYYLKTLRCDSSHYDALLHLAFLYEDAGEYAKALKITRTLNNQYPQDKDASLFYALISYRNNKIEQAHTAFRRAIARMDEQEKQDFTFHSVNYLLDRFWADKDYNNKQIKFVKERYWQMNDPALLTTYNERLIEHYARVAYANLRFSVPSMDIKGWATDRGKIMIRYGHPLNRVRMRPQMSDAGKVMAKTDVWNYGDFTLGFTDEYSSGNFRFSVPAKQNDYVQSQYNTETRLVVNNLKNTESERYKPVFEGPQLDIANRVAQFRNPYHFTNDKTDVYVYYGLPRVDSLKNTDDSYKHNVGLFFFNSHHDMKFDWRRYIDSFKPGQMVRVLDSIDMSIYAARMSIKPDSGSIAFEVLRDFDKGISTNHGKFKIRSFSRNNLDMSDVVLASAMDFEASPDLPLRRNDVSFAPNPSLAFRPNDSIYMYSEVYNLEKGGDDFTDFDQLITINRLDRVEPSRFSKFISGIGSLLGLGSSDQVISLRSNYQTENSDTPIYLQLDMSGYDPGNYEIILAIIDNVSGHVVSDRTEIYLR